MKRTILSAVTICMISCILAITAYADLKTTPYSGNPEGTWQQRGDDYYYVLSDGSDLKNGYVDGYYLSYTGRMINESPAERAVNKVIATILNHDEEDYVLNTYMDFAFTDEMLEKLYTQEELNNFGYKYIYFEVEDPVKKAEWMKAKAGKIAPSYIGFFQTDRNTNKNIVDTQIKNISKAREEYIKVQSFLEPYILDIIQSEMPAQIEKIHDTVCAILSYDMRHLPSHLKTYKVLELGKGQCSEYAQIFKYLMNACGYDCDYITGITLPEAAIDWTNLRRYTATKNSFGCFHAWNGVPTENGYRYVDVTWNDGDVINRNYYMKDDLSSERTIIDNYEILEGVLYDVDMSTWLDDWKR